MPQVLDKKKKNKKKTIIFANNMTSYIENPKEYT